MSTTEFRERLWDCQLALQRVKRDELRVSQAWIAREMKRRGITVSASGISYWFSGESQPGDLQTYVILAEVLSWDERGTRGWVDPGWLAFGEKTDAPAPDLGGGGYVPMPRNGSTG